MAGTILNQEKDSDARKARKIEQQEKQKKCYKTEVNLPSPYHLYSLQNVSHYICSSRFPFPSIKILCSYFVLFPLTGYKWNTMFSRILERKKSWMMRDSCTTKFSSQSILNLNSKLLESMDLITYFIAH